MALVFSNVGETTALDAFTGKTAAPSTYIVRLFTNDYTPVEAMGTGSFTEASGGGYVAISLAAASWNAAVSGDPSYATYAEQTWTFTGALDTTSVYGYYVTDGTTTAGTETVVYWAERFTGAPFYVTTNGDQIRLTPRLEAS